MCSCVPLTACGLARHRAGRRTFSTRRPMYSVNTKGGNMEANRMNRRKFLETGAGVLASSMAAPHLAHQDTSRKKRIRVGLIGCGSVSGRYLPDLADCPYAEVVSLCDIRPERA